MPVWWNWLDTAVFKTADGNCHRGGSKPPTGTFGEVAEWSMASDLGSDKVHGAFAGSNPALSV